MPLYEYECKQCGDRFEKIQKFSDEPEKVCPKCGGEVERLLSAPAVQFKGAGWYVTDYARKGSSSAAKDGKGSSEATDKSSGEKAADSSTGSKGESSPSGKSTVSENK